MATTERMTSRLGGHIGDMQPGRWTDDLLGTHWHISPASQYAALPTDTAATCRLALLAKKLPA